MGYGKRKKEKAGENEERSKVTKDRQRRQEGGTSGRTEIFFKGNTQSLHMFVKSYKFGRRPVYSKHIVLHNISEYGTRKKFERKVVLIGDEQIVSRPGEALVYASDLFHLFTTEGILNSVVNNHLRLRVKTFLQDCKKLNAKLLDGKKEVQCLDTVFGLNLSRNVRHTTEDLRKGVQDNTVMLVPQINCPQHGDPNNMSHFYLLVLDFSDQTVMIYDSIENCLGYNQKLERTHETIDVVLRLCPHLKQTKAKFWQQKQCDPRTYRQGSNSDCGVYVVENAMSFLERYCDVEIAAVQLEEVPDLDMITLTRQRYQMGLSQAKGTKGGWEIARIISRYVDG